MTQFLNKNKFLSKNEMNEFFRDLTSVKYHQQLVEKALQVVRDISDVKTVILRGSLATHSADLFSDIDFVLVHEGGEKTASTIKEQFMARLDEIGHVIHLFYSTVNLQDPVIYFKPFIKFELNIRSAAHMRNRWTLASAQILFDRNGLGKKIVQEAQKIVFDFVTYQSQVRNAAVNVPSLCYIIGGYLVRGEHITAIDDLDWLRNYLLTISGWFLGLWNEGPRRAEQRFPRAVLEYYIGTRVKNPSEVWDALQLVLDWFSEWLVPHFEAHQIPHTLHEVILIREMLDQLQNKLPSVGKIDILPRG